MSRPRTVAEAVQFLAAAIPEPTLQLIRGAESFRLAECHFTLGMWVRSELGLWDPESELLQSCRVASADEASAIILMALWDHLVKTATTEELARSRERRRAFEAERAHLGKLALDREAAEDARITDRTCPFCGQPCPSYRKTCKHCRRDVRTSGSPG